MFVFFVHLPNVYRRLRLALYNLYSNAYRRSATGQRNVRTWVARSIAGGARSRKMGLTGEICTHTPNRHLRSRVGQRKEADERPQRSSWQGNTWGIWSAVNPACFHLGGSDGVLHENICLGAFTAVRAVYAPQVLKAWSVFLFYCCSSADCLYI